MTSVHESNPKCPCCSNPWAAATGELFAKLCQECEEKSPPSRGLDRSNMDFEVRPKDNFYLYSNGNWIKNNPIPAGYPSWNSFTSLHVKSQEDLKEILTELVQRLQRLRGDSEDGQLTADERKAATFYHAAMDEETIEQAGTTPMKPLLDLCAKAAAEKENKRVFAECLGTMARCYKVRPFFAIGASPDKTESDHSIPQVYQGGIGLPDRDYYFDEDKQEQREAYKKTVALMLTLLDDSAALEPTEEALSTAERVFALEKALAEAHMTKTENRDPHKTYNKMTIAQLSQLGEDLFDFAAYFESATKKTLDDLGDINLYNVDALKKVPHVIHSSDITTLHAYFRWMAVASCAEYLSKPFVDAHFHFYQTILQGTQQIKPRWKRAIEFTEAALGQLLGKLYCAKFFDTTSKDRALAIVEQVRQALEERLKEVDWIQSDFTRQNALKKMSRFGVKIGYPDKWIDYDSLHIHEHDSFLDMVFKTREFKNNLDIKEMNAPTDKLKWFLTPQTVNAYYHPSLNEIVFPAAILQPPFFDKDADDAVNFGSMGAVIGHEMTHGFDDKGRKYDFSGNMNDWWTEDDGKEYERRVVPMVQQAERFEVHGQNVKGALTSGENIADLGGLRLALRGMKNKQGYDPTLLLDGFTPVQRFFLSWAQCWRQNITKERALQLLTIDPHGPNELRCNGPLSNIPEFHEAFDVDENSPMFKPVEARVDIW